MQPFDSVSRWFSAIPVGRRNRAGPRVEVNDKALLDSPAADGVCPVLLRDLSSGGACIRTDLRLSCGDSAVLVIGSDDDQFEFAAKVISVRPQEHGVFAEYGLRIVEVTMENAAKLNAFVDRRTETASVP
jgi:hypothetical protein